MSGDPWLTEQAGDRSDPTLPDAGSQGVLLGRGRADAGPADRLAPSRSAELQSSQRLTTQTILTLQCQREERGHIRGTPLRDH